MDDFESLKQRYVHFVEERDWGQFHDPRSLVLALVGEVGELSELFQWVPDSDVAERFGSGHPRQRVQEELSDVLLYLIALANALDVDLVSAAHAKLTSGEKRFPVDEVRGRALLKE